jgi:hypothetical protein
MKKTFNIFIVIILSTSLLSACSTQGAELANISTMQDAERIFADRGLNCDEVQDLADGYSHAICVREGTSTLPFSIMFMESAPSFVNEVMKDCSTSWTEYGLSKEYLWGDSWAMGIAESDSGEFTLAELQSFYGGEIEAVGDRCRKFGIEPTPQP